MPNVTSPEFGGNKQSTKAKIENSIKKIKTGYQIPVRRINRLDSDVESAVSARSLKSNNTTKFIKTNPPKEIMVSSKKENKIPLKKPLVTKR